MLHISLMEAAIFAKTVATVTVFQQVLPVMYMQVSSLVSNVSSRKIAPKFVVHQRSF